MRVGVLIAIALALAAGRAAAQEKQVIRMPGSLEGLPFSSAVRVNDLLFLSGQIGAKPGTRELVSGGIAAETPQTLENIKAILEEAGSSFDLAVSATVHMTNLDDFAIMNKVSCPVTSLGQKSSRTS